MGLAISNDEYLKRQLRTKRIERDNELIRNQISISVHNSKMETFYKDIQSLESQLEEEE